MNGLLTFLKNRVKNLLTYSEPNVEWEYSFGPSLDFAGIYRWEGVKYCDRVVIDNQSIELNFYEFPADNIEEEIELVVVHELSHWALSAKENNDIGEHSEEWNGFIRSNVI